MPSNGTQTPQTIQPTPDTVTRRLHRLIDQPIHQKIIERYGLPSYLQTCETCGERECMCGVCPGCRGDGCPGCRHTGYVDENGEVA